MLTLRTPLCSLVLFLAFGTFKLGEGARAGTGEGEIGKNPVMSQAPRRTQRGGDQQSWRPTHTSAAKPKQGLFQEQ